MWEDSLICCGRETSQLSSEIDTLSLWLWAQLLGSAMEGRFFFFFPTVPVSVKV